jgi:hypothetical protein
VLLVFLRCVIWSRLRCGRGLPPSNKVAFLRLFLDAPDEVLEAFIIGRRNRSGKNFHAAALARMRAANLQSGRLSEWGRRGAQVQLEKRRAAMLDGSTPSLAASLPKEVPTSTAPSSG